ncbi:MAG: ribonuclease H-like YkuK family protein [Candidatus Magasanikbacteria bacterium]
MAKKTFNTSSGLQLDISEVSAQITDFIQDSPQKSYKVIIGTDSEGIKENKADFVTAIVVYRKGRGGRYFWRRLEKKEDYFNMRERILKEVMLSLEAAKNIVGSLEEKIESRNWDFEIHVDVGTQGPSRKLIKEVVGMIRANDFEAKTKPESYAASSVADRHV